MIMAPAKIWLILKEKEEGFTRRAVRTPSIPPRPAHRRSRFSMLMAIAGAMLPKNANAKYFRIIMQPPQSDSTRQYRYRFLPLSQIPSLGLPPAWKGRLQCLRAEDPLFHW